MYREMFDRLKGKGVVFPDDKDFVFLKKTD